MGGMTQDNFILPAPPVGGLPISQDWLDRMKLVHDRTIPIILPSGKNILADAMCLQSLSGTPTLTQAILVHQGWLLKLVVLAILRQNMNVPVL